MAFVSEAERGLGIFDYETSHLAPGKYLGVHEYKTTQSYAPFCSLAERSKENTKKNKFITPGPGQYQVSKPIGAGDTSTTMTQDQTLILKIQQQGTGTFKSRQQRFKSFETPNPGPGQYSKENSFIEKKQSHHKPSSQPTTPDRIQMLDGLRSINQNRKIASIPNRIIKIYHDPTSEIVDINKLMEQNQVGGIGPGKYEIKDTFSENKNKGANWSKSQGQRFQQNNVTQYDNIGPGKYNTQKQKVPKYKANPSAAFISETVRTYYDNIYYQTQNEMKAQIRRETGFKDVTQPGPAHYNIENVKNAIKVQTKPLVHQYFGSTLERFKETEKPYNIAPGQYKMSDCSFDIGKKDNEKQQQQQLDNNIKISFLSSEKREDTQLKKILNDHPGVGSYDINSGNSIKDQLVRKYHMGYKGKFGTNEDRFKENDKKLKVPGPGQYNSEVVINEKSKCDNSYFRSTTNRNPFGLNEKDAPGIGIGEYTVNINTIGYKIEKQKLFIDNLKKIDVTRPGFDSSKLRFSHYDKRTRAQSTLQGNDVSPIQQGQQNNLSMTFINEIDNKFGKLSGRAKTSDKQKTINDNKNQAPFLFNSKKVDYVGVNTNPGPGKYKSEKLTQWTKRSYNIKYQPTG